MRWIHFLLAAVLFGNGLALQSSYAEAPGKAPPANLLLDFSGKLIDAAARQPVERVEPFAQVREEVLISGTGRVVGKARAELIPDPCRGVIEVTFSGQLDACATAQHPQALVHTRVSAPLVVGRRIILTPRSICSVPGPAAAQALIGFLGATDQEGNPDSTPADIAEIRFRRDREELEAAASREIARGASQRLGDELAPLLADASRKIGDSLRELKKRDLTVDDLRFQTTACYLQVQVAVDTADGPTLAPPPELPEDADLALRVHVSLLNRLAEAMLAGKTYRLSELQTLVQELTGVLLHDDRDEEERKRAVAAVEKVLKGLTGEAPTLTFAAQDPLTVTFVKDGFRVEANIASVTLDGTASSGARLRAAYRLEHRDGRVLARREGPIFVLVPPPDKVRKKLPPLDPARRLILETVAGEFFQSRLTLAELAPPAPARNGASLRALRAESDEGWFLLSWKLPASPSK